MNKPLKKPALAGLGILIIVLSLTLAACGSDPTATATPQPALTDPQAIAKKAIDTFNNTVNTVHFHIDIKSGEVTLYKGITFKTADGDLLKPDKYKATLNVSVAIAKVQAQTVGIADKQWLLLPNLSSSWQELPANIGFKASILFDQQQGLGAVVGKVKDLTLDGTETIDNTDCYRLKGIVSGPDISPLTAGTLGKNDVDFTVWIAKSDFLVHQVTFKERSSDKAASDWQMNFTKFNDPVQVDSPVKA